MKISKCSLCHATTSYLIMLSKPADFLICVDCHVLVTRNSFQDLQVRMFNRYIADFPKDIETLGLTTIVGVVKNDLLTFMERRGLLPLEE